MKKLLSIILAGLLIFSLAACTQSSSGNEDGSGVSQKDGGKKVEFSTKIPGLPDYPYGEMVREEKHEDGSGSYKYFNTTFEEFKAYCTSLKDEGIVPDNENLDFYTDGDRYYCKNEDAGYDYSIRFYEEPDYMTKITDGVEEKIYWHVSIGYGEIK